MADKLNFGFEKKTASQFFKNKPIALPEFPAGLNIVAPQNGGRWTEDGGRGRPFNVYRLPSAVIFQDQLYFIQKKKK